MTTDLPLAIVYLSIFHSVLIGMWPRFETILRKERRPFSHNILTDSVGGWEQVIISHMGVELNRRFCSLALYQLAWPGISMSRQQKEVLPSM